MDLRNQLNLFMFRCTPTSPFRNTKGLPKAQRKANRRKRVKNSNSLNVNIYNLNQFGFENKVSYVSTSSQYKGYCLVDMQ